LLLTRCNKTFWRRPPVGTILGAAILAVLAKILGLTNVSHSAQQIIKGIVIIAAMLIEILRKRKG
jgi:ribose/xylose/arabinose/galactoside ABC-type transport system permease subunit